MPPTPRVELRSLGGLQLVGADGADLSPILARPRLVALLAYLAAAPNGLRRRDTILGLLWPESDQKHARGALRQSLYLLRQSFGDAVLVRRGEDELGVDPAALWYDGVAFDQACDAGRSDDALGLYRGDFLEGFFVSDAAPEFDEWVNAERIRLRRRAGGAAWLVAAAARARGDQSAAVTCARRATALLPDDEGELRRLVTFLDDLGDRAGALQAYEEFAGRLAKEYESGPAAETQKLMATIRSHPAPVPASLPLPAPERGASISSAEPPPAAMPAQPAVHSVGGWKVVGLMALAALAAVGYLVAFRSARPLPLDPKRVIAAPLENKTGNAALDPVGHMAADWIAHGLMQTGLLDVVDARMVGSFADTTPRPAAIRARALAEESRAGTVVWGAVYREGDSLELQLTITDARSGRLLRAIDPAIAAVGEPLPAIEQLRRRVMGSLASTVEPQLSSWAGISSQPPTFEAYSAFLAGLDGWLKDGVDPQVALENFQRAAALDSSFVLPLVYVGFSYRLMGDCVRADSIWTRLLPRRDRLAPFDFAQLETMHAMCIGDWHTGLVLARRMAELAPASDYLAWRHALHAVRNNRPREAIAALEPFDPDKGWHKDRSNYWETLDEAFHLAGEYTKELEAARRGRAGHGEWWYLRGRELNALAALGKVPEVRAQLDTIRASQPPGDALHFVERAALELRAHGHAEASRALASSGLGWWEASPAASREDDDALAQRGRLLRLADRWGESETIFRALSTRDTTNLEYLGRLGTLVALRGDRAEAERIDSALARRGGPYIIGAHTFWRARIAAALGDRDRAVGLLREAYWQGHPFGGGDDAVPEWETIGDHPGFQELYRSKE